MKRFTTFAAAAIGMIVGGFAQAHDDDKNRDGSQPTINVNDTGNGTGNKTTIDPTAGSKVVVKGSDNGKNNTLTVAPDPHGTVVIDASANGSHNKIIVEEAPGEKVKIKGSANGKDNNIVIEKVPGPPPIKPLASAQSHAGNQSHKTRKY
jgi:hypothetical protein